MSGAPGSTPQRVSYRGYARRTPPREASPEPNPTDVVEETPSLVLSSSSSDVVVTGEVPAPVASAEYVTASAGTTTRTPTRGGTSQSRAHAEATPGSAAKRLSFSTPAAKRRRLSHGRTSLGGEGSRATATAGAGGGAGAAGTGGADIIEGWQKLTWKDVRGYLNEARRASTDYQVNPRAPNFKALRLSLTGRLLTESGKKGWWPGDFLCDEHELRTHGVRNRTPGVFPKYASRDQGSASARDFIDRVARIVTRFLRDYEFSRGIPAASGPEMDAFIGDCMSAILRWWKAQRGGSSAATAMPPEPSP